MAKRKTVDLTNDSAGYDAGSDSDASTVDNNSYVNKRRVRVRRDNRVDDQAEQSNAPLTSLLHSEPAPLLDGSNIAATAVVSVSKEVIRTVLGGKVFAATLNDAEVVTRALTPPVQASENVSGSQRSTLDAAVDLLSENFSATYLTKASFGTFNSDY